MDLYTFALWLGGCPSDGEVSVMIDTLTDLETLPPTMTVAEAGELLGISRRSAYRAVERGDLPALRLGRRLVVPSLKLLELLGVNPLSPPSNGDRGNAAASG